MRDYKPLPKVGDTFPTVDDFRKIHQPYEYITYSNLPEGGNNVYVMLYHGEITFERMTPNGLVKVIDVLDYLKI